MTANKEGPPVGDLIDQMAEALDHGDVARFEQLAALADGAQHEYEERLRAPDALAKAARWYAKQGIPVFPCRPMDKIPLIKSPHPEPAERAACPGPAACGQWGHGFADATTDLAVLHEWWERWPRANIGLATGHLFDVLDIDGPAGYQQAALLTLNIFGKVRTPGHGGRHWYLPVSGRGNRAKMATDLDYRGKGGYVVAPPSRTPNGWYEWLEPLCLPNRLPQGD